MTSWSGTARTLALGFGGIIVLFAAAAALALAGLDGIDGAMRRMRFEEEGVRLALELSSAVRDQYAHQAHTIIIGDDSHLHMYEEAEVRVAELARLVRVHAAGAEARGWVDDIDAASRELDEIFRRRIVPAVLRGERRLVQDEHARAQLVVTRIQDRAALLVAAAEGKIGEARAEADAVQRRTFRLVLALLVGAPVLAILVSLRIGRSIAVPLGRLSDGAARLAAGDLDARIDATAPDEFGALGRQFNDMAAAIKAHQSQLVQSEKLAGVGRLAAGVAHEINNPLGVILGYVRLMRKKAEGPLDADLAIVEEETLRAKEIVEGLLDLSRPLPAGGERVALRPLCDEVVARLGDARALDGVAVTVDGAAEVEGHSGKLRQVVANLVRNGAEAAGKGGQVRVRLSNGSGEVRVEVDDSGPGIPAAARDRLFEPFFTTKDRGTGLGLAVSRAIARAHGGDVEAGAAPGGGARFTLRLPRRIEWRA
ncbi:MAG TPA: HAMP domain-containing sensor histidine kinase [Anaeromyxobacteraceae bacterium]|nr:HAMP domain-containing sensor histidine kinase [Anaeromyxobacteraceae bacterium]